ncbi:hypothetical protein LZ554_008955 [Drepanopeziza brunnea f. sp. 'monogermtubi']|nr:hypothetical protein LZ554_008955 [Drepanopeziza brunnea f. sp. 'monogermtubi']
MVCNSTNCAIQGSASQKVMVCQNTTLPTLNPEVKVVPMTGVRCGTCLPNLWITLLSSCWSAGRYKLELRRFSSIFSMVYGESSTSPARDQGDCDG